MVNPWTTLQGPVDWTTAKKEADKRALNQVDKNIANLKEQGDQWVEAAGQPIKLWQELARFSETAAGVLAKDKAKKAEDEKLKDNIRERRMRELGITTEVAQDLHFAKVQNWGDTDLLKKLKERGIPDHKAEQIVSLGEKDTTYALNLALIEETARLPGRLDDNKEFLQELQIKQSQLNESELRNWIYNKANAVLFDSLDIEYSDEIIAEHLHPTLSTITDGYIEAGELKGAKNWDAQQNAKNASYYKALADNNIPEGMAARFQQRVLDTANSIPENDPRYKTRFKFAIAKEIEMIQNLIDTDQITPSQLSDLIKGEIRHDGFKNKNNPEGLVSLEKAFFEADGSTEASLIDRLNEAVLTKIEANDDNAKATKSIKLEKGLEHIINNIKTPKEKLAAYDQLVEGLGGVDSFDEDTKKRLKAQSRIFRIKDLDENFKNQLRNQTLDKTDLSEIKDAYPAIYKKFAPIVEIQTSDLYQKALGTIDVSLAGMAEWDLEKSPGGQLPQGLQKMGNALKIEANNSITDQLLALPPEQLTPEKINQITTDTMDLFNTRFLANGGGPDGIKPNDEDCKELFHYSQASRSFPLWNARNLGFNSGETKRSIISTTQAHYENYGDALLTTKTDDNNTPFFSRKQLTAIGSNGALSYRAKQIYASLPTKVKDQIEGGPAGFIRSQAELLDIDVSAATKGAEDYYNLTTGDPYISEIIKNGATLSPEAFERGQMIVKEAEKKQQEADNKKEEEDLDAWFENQSKDKPVEKEVLSPNHPLLQEGAGTRTPEKLYNLIESVLKGEQDLTELSPEIQAIVNQFKLQ